MGATLVLAKKDKYTSGLLVEAVIWQLPEPTADRPHGLKYRLYCGRGGECIVRYDSETAKGTTSITALQKNRMCFQHFNGWFRIFTTISKNLPENAHE